MGNYDNSNKELVKQFMQLMQSCEENKTDVKKVMDFLGQMLRTKRPVPPPTTELITLLKHHKPILYLLLKKSISPTSSIAFILNLDMNYEAVIERLGLNTEI